MNSVDRSPAFCVDLIYSKLHSAMELVIWPDTRPLDQ